MKQKRSLVKSVFAHTMLGLNAILCIWSALCYLASTLSPATIYNLAPFSISIPFAIVFNLFFIVFWLFTAKKWRALISLTTLLLCYPVFMPAFGYNFFSSNDFGHKNGNIKIMSWNAHGFGIYDTDSGRNGARMLQYIQEENPDILCIPEYNVMCGDSMKPNTAVILKNNGFSEYRFNKDNVCAFDKNIHLGIALFSKFPVENFIAYPLDTESIYFTQCDIRLPGNKIFRLFCAHLFSFGISDYDIHWIEQLKGRKIAIGDTCDYDIDFVHELNRRHIKTDDHFRVFMFKFNLAYEKRAKEADSIANIIKKSPYPVVLCGDFNDVPGSYTYCRIRGKLLDAFVEKGKGPGRTFKQILPTLRIDDIFYDHRFFKIAGYKSPPLSLSDHNPVIADFIIRI